VTLEQAIFNHLSTYAGLTALIGTRLYPVNLPQGSTLPAVTYQRISSVRMRTFGAARLGRVVRVQFTAWALSYASRHEIAEQLTTALEGYDGLMGGTGGVVVLAVQADNELDDYEPTAKAWQAAMDFTVTHLGG
jgi:hypothetical protein